jgi:hypothetical protein
MKTKIKQLIYTLVLLLTLSCNKQSLLLHEEKPIARMYGKTGCACLPEYVNPICPECITKFFMGNLSEAKYEAYFTQCQSTDPSSNGCQPSITTPYKVTFCYAQPTPNKPNDCSLYMQIDDAPECIKCITSFPYCVKLKASCSTSNNNDYVITLDDDDPNTPPVVEMQYSISQDPKFTICCKKEDPNFPGIFYTYCCSGDLIKTP